MTIDFAKFSLGKQEVTIRRYTGIFAEGVFTRTLASTIVTQASVQPWESINPDLVQDEEKGNFPLRILLMYSSIEVFMDDRNNGNETADEVVVLGKTWEPVKVDNWGHLGQQHFRTILKEFDGY